MGFRPVIRTSRISIILRLTAIGVKMKVFDIETLIGFQYYPAGVNAISRRNRAKYIHIAFDDCHLRSRSGEESVLHSACGHFPPGRRTGTNR